MQSLKEAALVRFAVKIGEKPGKIAIDAYFEARGLGTVTLIGTTERTNIPLNQSVDGFYLYSSVEPRQGLVIVEHSATVYLIPVDWDQLKPIMLEKTWDSRQEGKHVWTASGHVFLRIDDQIYTTSPHYVAKQGCRVVDGNVFAQYLAEWIPEEAFVAAASAKVPSEVEQQLAAALADMEKLRQDRDRWLQAAGRANVGLEKSLFRWFGWRKRFLVAYRQARYEWGGLGVLRG